MTTEIQEFVIKDFSAKLAAAKKGPKRDIVPERMLCDPACECRGTGFVTHLRTETDFRGKQVQVERTETCQRRRTAAQILASGLSRDELDLQWDAVKDLNNAGEAVSAVKDVLQRGYGWVYLWGGPGLAKTLILKIATALSIQRGATYTSMTHILNHLRQSYDTDYPNDEVMARLEKWKSIPVLAIDEVDKVKLTEFVEERRFDILDHRHVTGIRGDTITLFAANSAPSGFDDWTKSRFEDGRMHVVELKGPDMRPSMHGHFDRNGQWQS